MSPIDFQDLEYDGLIFTAYFISIYDFLYSF